MIVGGNLLICALVMNDETISHSSGSANSSAIGASTRCQGRRAPHANRASRRALVDTPRERDDEQAEREHVGRGRAVAGVEELERLLPDVEHDDGRRLQRPAARGHVDEVEQLQRLERLPHEQEHRHRAQRRAAPRARTRPSAARRRSTPPPPARAGCPAARRGRRSRRSRRRSRARSRPAPTAPARDPRGSPAARSRPCPAPRSRRRTARRTRTRTARPARSRT